MDERQSVGITSVESALIPHEEGRKVYGDVVVLSRKTGARMAWSEGHQKLRVNTTLFQNEDQARIATLRQVAGHLGLTQAIRKDASILLQTIRDYPEASEPILRWQGLARLKESNPDILRDQPINSQNQTLVQEFQWALDTYVLTGRYPDHLSDAVTQAVKKIPKSRGQSLVDYIACGRHFRFDGQNFATHLKPLIDELAATDRQTGQSQKFEYRPFQTQDINDDKEPIQEADIAVRVTPFYGGYYREQVCRYDPSTRQIVKESGMKQSWDIDEAPEDESVWKTKRTYEGVIQPGQEVLVKLPYGTLPLVSTLQPANSLHFMRDDLGIVYLDPRTQRQAASGKFSFDFVLTETQSNQLNVSPSDRDLIPVGGAVDPQTQEFLDELSSQNWMNDVQKAREIALYVRKKFRYPEDAAEIGQIDSLYLSVFPQELWTKMTETGIAHCYWANIFRDELCKRIRIASRIATGSYVGSKDPRFDFAIVEAKGMDKHAWGEVWDPDKEIWIHKGMDATPAKKQDKQEEQDSDQEPLEGDFGESLVGQSELSQEEIEKLYQEFSQQDQQTIQPPTPEELAAKQFEQEKGIAWEQWHQLETWINGVNRTPVPAQSSISHRQSTIYDEWRQLFDLLYKRREIPQQVYKGPVRQSEGEILDDSVTAFVDIRSYEDDPLGYQMSHVRQKERVEVSVFEDDFILDISGSMSGLPADEQRKMVLSSEYNIKNLNERLGLSRYRGCMTTPLAVKSRVAVFGDWTSVAQESTDFITERGLVELDGVLKSHNQSSRGLRESLKQYREALDPATLQKIKKGGYAKVLTVVSDGDVDDQAGCINEIKELRAAGVVVQGIGFGSEAQDIKIVCHDPADPDTAVVIDDVSEATLVRHKLLMKQLSKL